MDKMVQSLNYCKEVSLRIVSSIRLQFSAASHKQIVFISPRYVSARKAKQNMNFDLN